MRMDTEKRLTDLESTIAFQDHTINELNEVVIRLQDQVERLETKLQLVIEQASMAMPEPTDEEPPPHY